MNASEHPSQQGYEPPLFKDPKPDFSTNHGEPAFLVVGAQLVRSGAPGGECFEVPIGEALVGNDDLPGREEVALTSQQGKSVASGPPIFGSRPS